MREDASGAVQLVEFLEDGRRVRLNHGALERVLQAPEVRDRRVAVVSVQGAYRRGKSFLLNFFLRYLRSQGESTWLGDPEQRVEGFSWRFDVERVTTGILLWPEAFILDDVAVLLLDTQGTFDNVTTMQESTAIVAISALLSSLTIFNLSERIESKDLDNFKYFLEYGATMYEQTSGLERPFQHLLFLVRDWKFETRHALGYEGGSAYLDSVLHANAGKTNLENVNENLEKSFGKTECFLMPFPGGKVARDKNFTGRIADIHPKFVEQLRVLVPSILGPGRLSPKVVGGHVVRARDLPAFLHSLATAFNSDILPSPTTLLQMFAQALASSMVEEAHVRYLSAMQTRMRTAAQTGEVLDLAALHEGELHNSLQQFDTARKLGGEALATLSKDQLRQMIEQSYGSHLRRLHEERARNLATQEAVRAAAAEAERKEREREQLEEQLKRTQRELEETERRGQELDNQLRRIEEKERAALRKREAEREKALQERSEADRVASEERRLQQRKDALQTLHTSILKLLKLKMEAGETLLWAELHDTMLAHFAAAANSPAAGVAARYELALLSMEAEDPRAPLLRAVLEDTLAGQHGTKVTSRQLRDLVQIVSSLSTAFDC